MCDRLAYIHKVFQEWGALGIVERLSVENVENVSREREMNELLFHYEQATIVTSSRVNDAFCLEWFGLRLVLQF